MNIEQIIDLWNNSKYDTLILNSLPVINHKGELTHGTGVYTKKQTILCGGVYKVDDYLLKVFNKSLYMLENVTDYYISFKEIIKGDYNERKFD